MSILSTIDEWLYGPKEVNLLDEMKQLMNNSFWIVENANFIEDRLSNLDQGEMKHVILSPSKQKFITLAFSTMGKFADYFFMKLLIKDKDENVLFHFYKKEDIDDFSKEVLHLFFRDCYISLLEISKDNYYASFDEILKSGVFICDQKKEELSEFLQSKNIELKDQTLEAYLADNFDEYIFEYLLFKDYNKRTMITEIRNNNLKRQIKKHNLSSIIEHFKLRY